MKEAGNKINCVIIDDEPLAIEQMVEFVSKVGYLNLVATFDNPVESIDYLKSKKVDLLFLDIHMDDLTGIELLESVDIDAQVIFATAYNDYAMKGYELNVVDYLLKPISYKRFLQAVDKVYNNIYGNINKEVAIDRSDVESEKGDFIFIKTSEGLQKINFNEVLYIEGMKEYLKIFKLDGKIITRNNFQSIEDILPTEKFIRIHRSYIVAIDKIKKIDKNRIYISDQVLPIGDIYKKYFFDQLKKSKKIL